MTRKRLEKVFTFIHTTFFPRWGRKSQWRVRVVADLPSQGKCDPDIKAISLQDIPKKNDDLYATLIHEICHAVAGVGHGKKWLTRMLKASETAKKTGYEELSKQLSKEVKQIRKAARLNARTIYVLIEDWASENSHLTYDEIIKGVGNHFGLYPEELNRKYKRCKEVYEKAIKGEFVTISWYRKEMIKEGQEILQKKRGRSS